MCSKRQDQLKTDLSPVSASDHRTGQNNEDDEENRSTTTTGAGTPSAKSKARLQPVKQPIQQEKFQQTRKTSRTIIHSKPLSLEMMSNQLSIPSTDDALLR
jgi:hypothetical protein